MKKVWREGLKEEEEEVEKDSLRMSIREEGVERSEGRWSKGGEKPPCKFPPFLPVSLSHGRDLHSNKVLDNQARPPVS